MILGWILTALLLAISAVVLERGRLRRQKQLATSYTSSFALQVEGGEWSVADDAAIRVLPSRHRVLVRGESDGWELEFIGFTAAAWLPLAMPKGRRSHPESILEDPEAFEKAFVPWDEGDHIRVERFKALLAFVEAREAVRHFYNVGTVARFVSTPKSVGISMRGDPSDLPAAQAIVEEATKLMTTLERAARACESSASTLPDVDAIYLETQGPAAGASSGAPLGVPSVDDVSRPSPRR